MTKTSRPASLLAFVLSAALLLGFAVPAVTTAAAGTRPTAITKALDYMHARQETTGGWAPANTPWAILAIVAGQEKPTAWDKSGKDPIDYLQAQNHETNAVQGGYPPSYYAKAILAYTAASKNNLVIQNAGTPRINLLAKLLQYRYDVDGRFSPDTAGDRRLFDVTTTTWALLALIAADQSPSGDLVSKSRSWLESAQNGDGGWALQTGGTSVVDSTAAAIQALRAAGVSASSGVVTGALAYLHALQMNDGGFPNRAGDVRSNAESTAWVIQALRACKIDPATWTKNGRAPAQLLRSLQKADGSFAHSKSAKGQSAMMTTTQAAIALAGRPFPFELGGKIHPPKHLPSFSSFKPGNGAVFSSTNDVSVEVVYTDPEGGTGINADAVRILVDTKNKTKNARISSRRLTLRLVDLTYGQHTIEVRIADRAGNVRTSSHTVTVSYRPGSGAGTTPTPTVRPTYRPTSRPTLRPTYRPTPGTTLYPRPTTTPTVTPTVSPTDDGSVTGTVLTPLPSPTPSVSGSAAATGSPGSSSGGSGDVLGATLLLMLPLGAGLSYWMHRRQAASLANAGQGGLLPGGGTPWQRLKGRLPGVS